jgi:SMI1 / KNR4 family (SUKH-1)
VSGDEGMTVALPVIDWDKEISKLVYIKQQIAALDQAGLYPHHLPAAAATQIQVDECQKALGLTFDSEYVDFLLRANGWDGFLQSTDLFGTNDLLGSDRYWEAYSVLQVHDESYFAGVGATKRDIIPIGRSSTSYSVYGTISRSITGRSRFYWFYSAEIEPFASFSEFFGAMVDYNLLVLKLEEEAQADGRGG